MQTAFENVSQSEMDSLEINQPKKFWRIEGQTKKALIVAICSVIIGLFLITYIFYYLKPTIRQLEDELEARSIFLEKKFIAKIDTLTYQLVARENQLQQNQVAKSGSEIDPIQQLSLSSEIGTFQQEQKQNSLNSQREWKKKFVMEGRQVPGENLLHDHQNQQWVEPTLGRPTKQSKFNFTEVSPQHYFEYEKSMEMLYKPYSDTNCEHARFGTGDDGSYILCKNFINVSTALINIGIMGVDDFGCQLTTQYKFMNYQYDCTDKPGVGGCETNEGRNRQNLFCLSDKTEGFEVMKYSTLQDMIEFNRLGEKHIILKMDSQGSEWGALRVLPLRYLQYIDQILIESHMYKFYKTYWGYADVMKRLSEHFVSVGFNQNNAQCYARLAPHQNHFYPSACFQNTFVNRKLIKLNSENRSYKKHPLNRIPFPLSEWRCPMTEK